MRDLYHGQRCKNKKLYSLYIVDDEENNEEDVNHGQELGYEEITPHISINVLEGISGFYTLIVNERV
jgi:hypothetical protein